MAQTLGAGSGRRSRGATVTGREPRGIDGKGAGSGDSQVQLNSAHRKEIVRDVFRDVLKLDSEIKSLNEDRRALLQSKVKGDLGMNITDFNQAYRLYLLESDDRDKAFDTLREVFDAMAIGAQLDFLARTPKGAAEASAAEASAGTTPAPAAEAADEHNPEHDGDAAAAEGYVAGKAGKNVDSHSYALPHQGRLKARFEGGWAKAQEEAAMRLGGKESAAAEQY